MYQGISPAYICFELGLRLVQLALPPGKGGAALSVEGPSWDCLRAHRSREPHGLCMGKRSLHGGPHCAILRVPLGSIKAPDRAVRVQATPTWWEVLGARFFGGGTYVPGSWTEEQRTGIHAWSFVHCVAVAHGGKAGCTACDPKRTASWRQDAPCSLVSGHSLLQTCIQALVCDAHAYMYMKMCCSCLLVLVACLFRLLECEVHRRKILNEKMDCRHFAQLYLR